MDVASLIKSLSDFGGLGIVVAFLIWWNVRCDKQRDKIADQLASAKQLEDERRLQYDRDRLATDKDIAANLSALSSAIQNLVRR